MKFIKKLIFPDNIRVVKPFFAVERWTIIWSMAALMGYVVLSPLEGYFVKAMIDDRSAFAVYMFIGIAILSYLFRMFGMRYMKGAIARSMLRLRKQVHHIMINAERPGQIPYSNLAGGGSGDLREVQASLVHGTLARLVYGTSALLCAGVLLVVFWNSTIITGILGSMIVPVLIGVIVVAVFVVTQIFKKLGSLRSQIRSDESPSDRVHNNICPPPMWADLRLHHRNRLSKMYDILERILASELRVYDLEELASFISSLTRVAVLLCIVGIPILLHLSGPFSIGFVVLVESFSENLREFARTGGEREAGSVAMQRPFRILGLDVSVPENLIKPSLNNSVELKNLNIVINGKKIVENISLLLGPGVTILQGRRGAGKTALFHALTGASKEDAGNVYIGGLLRSSMWARKQLVAGVFDFLAVIQPTDTVGIMLGASSPATMPEMIQAMRRMGGGLLDAVLSLPNLLETQMISQENGRHALSFFHRLLLGLARADLELNIAKRVVVLDAPFRGITHAQQLIVAQILDMWEKEGYVVIVMSEEEDAPYQPHWRIIRMERGRIVEQITGKNPQLPTPLPQAQQNQVTTPTTLTLPQPVLPEQVQQKPDQATHKKKRGKQAKQGKHRGHSVVRTTLSNVVMASFSVAVIICSGLSLAGPQGIRHTVSPTPTPTLAAVVKQAGLPQGRMEVEVWKSNRVTSIISSVEGWMSIDTSVPMVPVSRVCGTGQGQGLELLQVKDGEESWGQAVLGSVPERGCIQVLPGYSLRIGKGPGIFPTMQGRVPEGSQVINQVMCQKRQDFLAFVTTQGSKICFALEGVEVVPQTRIVRLENGSNIAILQANDGHVLMWSNGWGLKPVAMSHLFDSPMESLDIEEIYILPLGEASHLSTLRRSVGMEGRTKYM
jgi:ABC-type multidrug transport system fused ATPase/permease subunit